jgi:hypothetical protein
MRTTSREVAWMLLIAGVGLVVIGGALVLTLL